MTTENSTQEEERIRKVFVKDIKGNEILHTVFKAHTKTPNKGRSGKPYLALILIDKTGQLDGRVFDNVEAADAAFAAGDYLLVKGKVGHFHGKPQLVIERLEKLDAGPIEAADFEYVPVVEAAKAPAAPGEAPAAREPREKREDKRDPSQKATRARLLKLLDNPEVLSALDTIIRHLEGAETAAPHSTHPQGPRRERNRGPRVEHKPAAAADGHKGEKSGPKRDATLPEGIAFKPFTALVPAGNSSDGGTQG